MSRFSNVYQSIDKGMYQVPRCGCIALMLLCIVFHLPAQSDMPAYDIQPVTITATRTEKALEDVGRSVTVIGKAEIEKSIHSDLSELLSQQAGIYIPGTGQNPGAIQSLFMRGANNNQTVILIDGIRLMDPSSVDNAIDLAELSLAGVERIEIVRGAHSTLYGSSAIGGVVNIITKKRHESGLHYNASLEAGVFGEDTRNLTENLNMNYTFDNGFYISGEVRNTNITGLDATVDTFSNPNTYRSQDQDDFDKLDLVGKIGFRNGEWDIFGSYKRVDQTSQLDDGAYADDDNHYSEVSRDFVTWRAQHFAGSLLDVTYTGGYSNFERLIFDDSSQVSHDGTTDHSYYEGFFEGTTLQNELQLHAGFKGADLLLGGSHFRETMSSGSYYLNTEFGLTDEENLDTLGIEVNRTNVFVLADMNGKLLSESNSSLHRLGLVLGGRLNHHSSYGSHFTFEINPSYRLSDEAMLYGSISSGYAAPSPYRLFAPNVDFTSGITRGNPNLEPETSISVEFGLHQRLGDKLELGVALFRTITQNLIEYVYLWDRSIGIDTLGNDWMRNDFRGDTYLNIGTQTNTGIEISVKSKLSEKVSFSGNISLINGSLEYNPDDLDAEFTQGHHVQLYNNGQFLDEDVEVSGLVRRPHTANLNIKYQPFDQLSLNVGMRYAAARSDIYYESSLGPYGALAATPVEDYTIFDLNAHYAISDALSLSLKVENVFDTEYREINGYRTRGRGVYLGVRYAR